MAHRTLLRNGGIAGSGASRLNVHFSCATVEWETPQWLFDELSGASEHPDEAEIFGEPWAARHDAEIWGTRWPAEPPATRVK